VAVCDEPSSLNTGEQFYFCLPLLLSKSNDENPVSSSLVLPWWPPLSIQLVGCASGFTLGLDETIIFSLKVFSIYAYISDHFDETRTNF
jgi:hypothetical protein